MADPFLAEIIIFGGNFAPRNWALCDGQLLPINQYQALFSLLGTTYGGDGRTTFALPDLRGRVPVAAGQGSGLTNRSLGQRTGQEGVPLAPAEIRAHTHDGDATALTAQLRGHSASEADAGQPSPANVLSKNTNPVNVNTYSDSDANTMAIGGTSLDVSVQNSGNGQSHENRQPYLAVNYIIALVGVFPSRN